MGFNEDSAKMVSTDPPSMRSIEELGQELDSLDSGIAEMVTHRSQIRKEIANRFDLIREKVAKADEHFLYTTRGEGTDSHTEARKESPNYGREGQF